MKLIDPKHPFYAPRGRRIAITAICGLWFAFEALLARDMLWSVLAAAVFAYTAWVLLIKFPEPPPV